MPFGSSPSMTESKPKALAALTNKNTNPFLKRGDNFRRSQVRKVHRPKS